MASKLSIHRAKVKVSDKCAFCESEQDVNWYCNDCQEALCDKCKDGHKRARKTRNDDVVPIKEADKLGETILQEVCKTHRGKTCDLYCSEYNIAVCAVCLTEKHKQHAFKNIEEEIDLQITYIQDQLKLLKSKLVHVDDNLSERQGSTKSFNETVNVVRQSVQTQRLKLKEEIDSIADSILEELSSLVEDEERIHKQDCQYHEQKSREIIQLIKSVEQNTEKTSLTSLFEMTRKMRTTIPLHDVSTKTVLPRQPNFEPGKLSTDQLKKMIGYLQVKISKEEDVGYEREDVKSKQVRPISKFRLPQQKGINSICPVDDTHVWISYFNSLELTKINKKGKVKKTIRLDFHPLCLTVTNTKELLITGMHTSPLIHKLTNDTRVTRFADISPLPAWGISVSDSDEVFVTTHDCKTPILVLNLSGERIRQITCGSFLSCVVCLTTGNIAVTNGHGLIYCTEVLFISPTNQIIHRWNGKLDNGQKVKKTMQHSIARDSYDRVFVPDCNTHQVYVLSGNGEKAKCLLDQTNRVHNPIAVCVDRCGHVWIGCGDGTVHVMEL